MIRLALAITASLTLLAATPAFASEVVIVGSPSEVSGCEKVGDVRSSSMLGGLFTGAGYGRALAQLKNRAAALGGTHLQILSSSTGMAGSNLLGLAYRCPAASQP